MVKYQYLLNIVEISLFLFNVITSNIQNNLIEEIPNDTFTDCYQLITL